MPDPEHGFYQGTRFDWSGLISSLRYRGHEYCAVWYTKRDPSVRDFVFEGHEIAVGPQSAVTGPCEEFVAPQGYAAAKVGGTFVKIGVGVLRKVADAHYSCYDRYGIVDAGGWSTRATAEAVEFVHDLADSESGIGYRYRKTIRLRNDRPELVIEHTLRNTGRVPIATMQYNHNFLALDQTPTGPHVITTAAFPLEISNASDPQRLAVVGNQFAYGEPLRDDDVVSFLVDGFSENASCYDFRIESTRSGAGVRITGDRALARCAVWSIRTVLSVEPFIDIAVNPSESTTWTYVYSFYEASN